MAEQQEKIEPKLSIEPCNVFGSDEVLTDEVDIAYYKACIEEFEASNRLIGQIMHNGEYVISEEVKKDLLALPKELLSESENTVEAFARVLAKDLYFSIEVEDKNDQLVASLYVTENVTGYKQMKSIKTFVAWINLPKEDGSIDKVKNAYHVQKIVDTITESDYINLIMQIQDLIDYSSALDEIDALSSQIYVLRMLELLETSGTEAQIVLANYNREIRLRKLNKKAQYVLMRKLLDQLIEDAGGFNTVFRDKQKEARDIKKEYAAPIEKVESLKGKVVAKKMLEKKKEEPQKKTEQKSAAKKPSAKKSAGKSAGASKPKKAKPKKKKEEKGKKKDDKKKFGPVSGKIAGKGPTVEPSLKTPPTASAVAPSPIAPLVPRAAVTKEHLTLDDEVEALDKSWGSDLDIAVGDTEEVIVPVVDEYVDDGPSTEMT